MAEPRPRREYGGDIYEEQPDGSYVKISTPAKPTSIADGKVSKFTTPKVPYTIPGKAAILAEPATMEEIATPSIPGSGISAGAQSLLTPEGRKAALQQGLGLGASMIPGGGFFTNVAKSAIGTVGGNMIGQALEGKPEIDYGEVAQEGALDVGANLVLGGIPFVGAQAYETIKPFLKNVQKRGVKEAIARALLASPFARPASNVDPLTGAKTYVDPLRERNVPAGLTTRESLAAGAEVPTSVGTQIGSKGLKFVESLLQPEKLQVLTQEGTKANIKTIEKLTTPGTLGERGKEGLRRAEIVKRAFTNGEKKQYPIVDAIAEQNTVTVNKPGPLVEQITPGPYGAKVKMVPSTTPVTIRGPIFISKVADDAKEVLPEILKAMQEIRSKELMGDLPRTYKILSAFAQDRVIDYASARTLQANINKLIRGEGNPLMGDNATRLLKQLKTNLDADVLESMENHWKAGNAPKEFAKALNITRLKYGVFTERLQKAFQRGTETPEMFYNDAFKSVTAAKEFKTVVGPRAAGSEFLTRLRDKHMNTATGGFDAENALADWGRSETREVAKTLLTSAQRAGYEQFLKRQVAISGDPSNIGVLAFGSQNVNNAIGTARDLANLPNNPGNLFSQSGLRIAAVIGLGKFTEKVLLNPARAREASRLLSVNAARYPQATLDAQRFILGSKLGTILLRAENGEEVQYNTETGEATKLQ